MPMPLWWGHVNKLVFNPFALKRGKWPVLTHVGRTSGVEYRTPLEVHRVTGGFVFILVYGPESDWVRNVLSSGYATLEVDGGRFDLDNPRLITTEEAWAALPADTKAPPKLININDYLRMDASATA